MYQQNPLLESVSPQTYQKAVDKRFQKLIAKYIAKGESPDNARFHAGLRMYDHISDSMRAKLRGVRHAWNVKQKVKHPEFSDSNYKVMIPAYNKYWKEFR